MVQHPNDAIKKGSMLRRRKFGDVIFQSLRALKEFEDVEQIERRKTRSELKGKFEWLQRCWRIDDENTFDVGGGFLSISFCLIRFKSFKKNDR